MWANAQFLSIVLWKKASEKEALEKVEDLLTNEEVVELAYIAKRDKILFTNKRILIMNVQGLTWKKIDYHTIPYSKITSFSIETAGTFDLDSELKIWVSGLGGVEIKFIKGIDIKETGKYLTNKLI